MASFSRSSLRTAEYKTIITADAAKVRHDERIRQIIDNLGKKPAGQHVSSVIPPVSGAQPAAEQDVPRARPPVNGTQATDQQPAPSTPPVSNGHVLEQRAPEQDYERLPARPNGGELHTVAEVNQSTTSGL